MSTAPIASSPRLDWAGVPEPVRRSVEAALGSSIVSAVTQSGGFSPGAAVRAVLADGRRVFVKACGTALNPDTPDLNRAEILALGLLPEGVPAPRLLTSYDDGNWVALVLEDVEGRRPELPWRPADVTSMTTSLRRVAGTTAPAPLRTFAVTTNVLTGWDEVAADTAGVDTAVSRRLPEMREHQAQAGDVTTGSALVHWDARNDNVLVRPDGEAVLLDWAWACSGAAWLDTLPLGPSVRPARLRFGSGDQRLVPLPVAAAPIASATRSSPYRPDLEASFVANIKSQLKRIKTNEKARLRNKAVKSSLKTSIRKFRTAADAGERDSAVEAMTVASRQLDKAASKGVIHTNQAANRKSAMAKRAASL